MSVRHGWLFKSARWVLAVLVYLCSWVLAGYLWYSFSRYISYTYCPPGQSGYFGPHNDYACLWPLWVSFAKDIPFAVLAATVVSVPAVWISPARNAKAAILVGIVSAGLWMLFQYLRFNSVKHVMGHQLTVAAAFLLTLLAVCMMFRGGPSLVAGGKPDSPD